MTFAQAVATFFGIELGPGTSVDNLSPTLQLQDLSGRIARVLVGSAGIEVSVEGSQLTDMIVELASTVPGPSSHLTSEHEQMVEFALPDGLPSGAWVVLKQGSRWVDRKFLNYPHTLAGDPGVEVAVEPTTQIRALVSGGEGATVEFKREVPAQGTKAREQVCQTIAAFANADGGFAMFGVEDDGAIVGVRHGPVKSELCDMVTRFVSATVTPLPPFTVEAVDVEDTQGATVIVVCVAQGSQPPYGVNPDNPRYYVRRGSTTFPASADQVRALARSRPPSDRAYGFPYGLGDLG